MVRLFQVFAGNSGDRPVIRHNVVWGNNANGIHMNGDLSQGGDGIISGAIAQNLLRRSGRQRLGRGLDHESLAHLAEGGQHGARR